MQVEEVQRFWGSGFRVQGFRGSGFRVQGFRGSGFRGSGFRVQGFRGSGVQGSGVQGSGVQGFRARRAECRNRPIRVQVTGTGGQHFQTYVLGQHFQTGMDVAGPACIGNGCSMAYLYTCCVDRCRRRL